MRTRHVREPKKTVFPSALKAGEAETFRASLNVQRTSPVTKLSKGLIFITSDYCYNIHICDKLTKIEVTGHPK